MKRSIVIFLAFLAIVAILPVSSCTKDNPTFGILSLTFQNSDGTPYAIGHVYLATSYQNLQNGVYATEGWTDDSGYIKFLNLAPGWCWYKAEGYNDVGATKVDAGNDYHVILWLNSPTGGK